MHPIRFRQDAQITRCEGLLHLEGDRIRMEYEWIDKMFGLWRSGVKEAIIPASAIVSAKLTSNWFCGAKVVLQAGSMEAMREAPGMSQGRVELCIAKEDREAAQTLVDGLCKPAMAKGVGLYE